MESFCERLLPQGLLHQGSGNPGDFSTANRPFGKQQVPGEVNMSPQHSSASPVAEAADFHRTPTPSEQRAAAATVARGMGLVRLQRRLFKLLESLVQSKDCIVQHEVACRTALPSLLLRIVRMFRKVPGLNLDRLSQNECVWQVVTQNILLTDLCEELHEQEVGTCHHI